ncbi:hypothetical protein ECEPECC34262_2109 [Escherichia coli EPEC C342-62]|nr:hypothetical protein ECDEC10C_2626 [Escherichia coli DEC10C]EIQ70640.1 hypothetical protein ECEPECC34262_2109 [Escherichia coli EPEC C342-62]
MLLKMSGKCSQLLFHLAKGSVESVYEIVTRHNINHFSYNILIL